MPCIKCANGKWKYGEDGKIEYDTLEKCHQVAAAIHAQQNEQVKENMTSFIQLKEAFDKEPYPFEIDPKSNVSKIVYNFEEGNHKYKLEFAKKIYFGKKVYRIALSQRTGTLNTYRKIVTKFDDAFRTISTIIAATSDFLATHMGKVEGLAFGFPEKAFGVYGGMVQRIISKKLIAQLVSLDSNLQPTESDELGALQYVYFGTKVAASKGFDKIFNGEIQQQATKAIADIPLGTGVTNKLSGISTGQTGINTSQAAFAQSMGVLNSILKPMELTPEIVKGMIDHNKAMFAKGESDVNQFAWLQSKSLEIVLPVSGNLSKTFYSQKLNVVVDKATGKVVHIPAEKSNTDLNGLSFFNKGFFPGQADNAQAPTSSTASAPTDAKAVDAPFTPTPYKAPVTSFHNIPTPNPEQPIPVTKTTTLGQLLKQKLAGNGQSPQEQALVTETGKNGVVIAEAKGGGFSLSKVMMRQYLGKVTVLFFEYQKPSDDAPIEFSGYQIEKLEYLGNGMVKLPDASTIMIKAQAGDLSSDPVFGMVAWNQTTAGKEEIQNKVEKSFKAIAFNKEVVANAKALGKFTSVTLDADTTFRFNKETGKLIFVFNILGGDKYRCYNVDQNSAKIIDDGEDTIVSFEGLSTSIGLDSIGMVATTDEIYTAVGQVEPSKQYKAVPTDTKIVKAAQDAEAAKITAIKAEAAANFPIIVGNTAKDGKGLIARRVLDKTFFFFSVSNSPLTGIEGVNGYNLKDMVNDVGELDTALAANKSEFIPFKNISYAINGNIALLNYLNTQANVNKKVADIKADVAAKKATTDIVNGYHIMKGFPAGGDNDDKKLFELRIKTEAKSNALLIGSAGAPKFDFTEGFIRKINEKAGTLAIIIALTDGVVKYLKPTVFSKIDSQFLYFNDADLYLSDIQNVGDVLTIDDIKSTFAKMTSDVVQPVAIKPPSVASQVTLSYSGLFSALHKKEVKFGDKSGGISLILDQLVKNNNTLAAADEDNPFMYSWLLSDSDNFKSFVPMKYSADTGLVNGYDVNSMTSVSPLDFTGNPKSVDAFGFDAYFIGAASIKHTVSKSSPTLTTPHQQSLLAAVEKNTPLLNGAPTDIGNFDVRYDTNKERMVIVIGYEPKTDEYEGFIVDDILNSDWDIDVTLTNKSPVKGLGTWLGLTLTGEAIAVFVGQMPNALKPAKGNLVPSASEAKKAAYKASAEKNSKLLYSGSSIYAQSYDIYIDSDAEPIIITDVFQGDYTGFKVSKIVDELGKIDVKKAGATDAGQISDLGDVLSQDEVMQAIEPLLPKIAVSVEDVDAAIDNNRKQVAINAVIDYTSIITKSGHEAFPIKGIDANTFSAVLTNFATSVAEMKNTSNRTTFNYIDVKSIKTIISLNAPNPAITPASTVKSKTAQASYQGTALSNDTTEFTAEIRKWLTDNPPAAITKDIPVGGESAWDAYVKKDIKILGGMASMNFKNYTGDLSQFLQTYGSSIGNNTNVLSEVINGLRAKADPLFKALAKENGLVGGEPGMEAVQSYTGSGYGSINNFLRGKTSSAEGKARIKQIDDLYRKKGMRIAKDLVVYRGQRMEEETIQKLIKGQPYMFRAYTSTSTNLSTAIAFSKADVTHFVNGKEGTIEKPHILMLISGLDSTLSLVPGDLSSHVSEDEVILNRGTIIKIDSSVPPVKKKGTYIIAFKVVDLVNPIMLESFQQFKKGLNTPAAEVKKDMAIAVDMIDEIFNENPELMQKEIDDSVASGSAIERFSDDA